jgi:hypothetical protein
MDYVEYLDAYEGDALIGTETINGTIVPKWLGIIKFDENCGRIRIHDIDADEWHEIDAFDSWLTLRVSC